MKHGIDCRKVRHVKSGYLHGDNDDTPYDVDGMQYCGRCHMAMDMSTPDDKKGIELAESTKRKIG